jgi:hypothetical protein
MLQKQELREKQQYPIRQPAPGPGERDPFAAPNEPK